MRHGTLPRKRRPVNLLLDEDLVRKARSRTGNLSETVETLLGSFVAEAETAELQRQQRIEAHVAASNAFVDRHGTLADEFGAL